MDLFTSLKLVALRNVHCDVPDYAYQSRKILRWYSQTFFTPLHEAYKLPFVDVLTHYYEAQAEANAGDKDYTVEDLQEEFRSLTESAKERAEREAEEAAKEDDFMLEQIARQEQERLARQEAQESKEPKPLLSAAVVSREPLGTSHEPVIKMDFTEEEFEAELNGHGPLG